MPALPLTLYAKAYVLGMKAQTDLLLAKTLHQQRITLPRLRPTYLLKELIN